MASTTTTLTDRDAYRALEAHHGKVSGLHLRDLFAEDGERGTKLTAEGAGLYLDYSKHRLTDETVGLLVALAQDVGLSERIEAMFRGDRINVTENRSVLHTALRLPRGCKPGRRRAGRGRRGARRARSDGGLLRACARRRMDGAHR